MILSVTYLLSVLIAQVAAGERIFIIINIQSSQRNLLAISQNDTIKIFIVHGYQNEMGGGTLFQVDSQGTSKTCIIPAKIPQKGGTTRVVGTLYDGRPTICGGDSGSECFYYSTLFERWQTYGRIDTQRVEAASVDLGGNRWLIAGGIDVGKTSPNRLEELSSSVIFRGGVTRPGPELPAALSRHCLLRMNSSHLFLAGGYNRKTKSAREAYLFNHDEEKWTRLPDMKMRREDHGCAMLDGDKVIVFGGYGGSEFRETAVMEHSEILSLSTLTWSEGPTDPLMEGVAKWTAFPYMGSFLAVEVNKDSEWIWYLDREASEFRQFFKIGVITGYPILLPNSHALSC